MAIVKNNLLFIVLSIFSICTKSYHIQNTYSKKKSNNGDFNSEYDHGKSNNEYDIVDNDKKNKNRDSFRKNKSTVYGTVKNQRRNTKGILDYTIF